MKVSVIIPTYNEEDVIDGCLKSLSKQSLEDFEIIMVDDGSTDSTVKKIRDLNLRNLTLLTQEHKGAGAARNLGALKAKGEIIVFVDADMTFDEDFLLNLIKPIEEGSAKGTFSKEEYVSNWENVWARCWNINQGWEEKRRHPKNYPDKQKVFRAILKSEFERVGGFDEKRGYDDDWSLGEKLGYESVSAPGAIFYHKNPDNLVDVFKQAKWASKRKYKLGIIGAAYNLLVFSLPDSLWIGFWKSLFNGEPAFLIFKIVYDFGAFLGILENIFFGKVSK